MATRGRPRSFDRQLALSRALEVFWTQGFESASLSALTQAMGINSPSLYAAFGSKEALFREALDLYVNTEGDGIWNQVATAATARQAIERVLRASAQAFTRGPEPRGCLIVLAALQQRGTTPAICDELKKHRMENVELLEQRLLQAVSEGELPSRTDCRTIATYFATVQHGMSIQARDGASRETLLGIADSAMAAWDSLTA